MRLIKQMLKGAARNSLRLAERTREPSFLNRHRIFGIETVHGIQSTALLQVTGRKSAEESYLKLGPDVWIGERVEIEAVAPGSIEIGESTSFQHDCIVRGHVSIGAHCIFARTCLIISTTHHFRDKPEWLIADQDIAFRQGPGDAETSAIRIGEDCWFGACSAVMPGVSIGRGAIVGANTVVTRDIGPYEIHGGSPNRRIGQRLPFAPPRQINAMSDRHIPYFYQGFQLKQNALSQSRLSGVVAAGQRACLILDHTAETVEISGQLLQSSPLSLKTCVNGHNWKNHQLTGTHFNITIAAEGEKTTAPPDFLRHFTVVELHAEPAATGKPAYGIAEAKII